MRRFSILLPLVLTWGCTPTFSDLDPVTEGTGEGEGESGDDGTDGGEDTVGDTDSGGDPVGELLSFDFRIHDDIESLVYVTWTSEVGGTAHIEYSFDDGEWLQTPPQEIDAGDHEQLLLGIPYNETFEWKVVVDSGEEVFTSAEQEAYTGDLPSMPEPTVTLSDPSQYEPSGKYLMGSVNSRTGGWVSGNYWKFIMDREGRIVWASQTADQHWTIYMQPSYDGTSILWDKNTYWADWDGGRASQIFRMKIDGTIEDTYDVSGEHHVFRELADGSIVWGAASGSSETLEKLNPDGSQETIWDCREFHDSIGANSSCQSNTLFWHESEDTFLFSFYTTNTVVEIDHQTGRTLRQWGGELPQSWGFDPSDSVFWWQHGATYTDEGTLLLSTESGDRGDYETVAREYIVDDDTETLVEIWNFGVGENIHGDTAGETHRLANGNTLHNYGSAGHIREVTNDGQVVWEVEWSGNRLLGRTVFLDDLWAFAP